MQARDAAIALRRVCKRKSQTLARRSDHCAVQAQPSFHEIMPRCLCVCARARVCVYVCVCARVCARVCPTRHQVGVCWRKGSSCNCRGVQVLHEIRGGAPHSGMERSVAVQLLAGSAVRAPQLVCQCLSILIYAKGTCSAVQAPRSEGIWCNVLSGFRALPSWWTSSKLQCAEWL